MPGPLPTSARPREPAGPDLHRLSRLACEASPWRFALSRRSAPAHVGVCATSVAQFEVRSTLDLSQRIFSPRTFLRSVPTVARRARQSQKETPGWAGGFEACPGAPSGWTGNRRPPAMMFRRRSYETIFQSPRSRPEMITS